MKKLLGILVLGLLLSGNAYANIESKWVKIASSKDRNYLVDNKSIYFDDMNKESFFFLSLEQFNKPFDKELKAITRLIRYEINCSQKKMRVDMQQWFDVKMPEGLSENGNTVYTSTEKSNWQTYTSKSIGTTIVNHICRQQEKTISKPEYIDFNCYISKDSLSAIFEPKEVKRYAGKYIKLRVDTEIKKIKNITDENYLIHLFGIDNEVDYSLNEMTIPVSGGGKLKEEFYSYTIPINTESKKWSVSGELLREVVVKKGKFTGILKSSLKVKTSDGNNFYETKFNCAENAKVKSDSSISDGKTKTDKEILTPEEIEKVMEAIKLME